MASGEDGFGLIEVLVTATLVAVGMVAIIGGLDSSRNLTTAAEENQARTHHAEKEMERILALPYDSIALTAAPATVVGTPTEFVTQGATPTYKWDQVGAGQTANLVVAAGGALGASQIAWADTQNRKQGSLYRFVTRTGDLCTTCPGTQQGKRITIAATVTGGKLKKPLLVSTVKTDPESANLD